MTRFEWWEKVRVSGSEMNLWEEMGTGGGVVEKEEKKRRRPPFQKRQSLSGDPVELCIAVTSLEVFCITPITTQKEKKNQLSERKNNERKKANLLWRKIRTLPLKLNLQHPQSPPPMHARALHIPSLRPLLSPFDPSLSFTLRLRW